MRNYSNEIIEKIELIKEIIVSRSILRNIRDDIKWELEIESDRINGKIYEITLYLKVIDQDCSECHFEPDGILEEIHKYQKSIYNSINKIAVIVMNIYKPGNIIGLFKENVFDIFGIEKHRKKGRRCCLGDRIY